jgi:hypothetical protein
MLCASICYIFPAFHHVFWVAYLCQMQRVRFFPLENPPDWSTLELVASAFRVCLVLGFAPTDVTID